MRTRTFGKGIVVSGFEHPSVQRPLEELAKQGYNVTVVKPRPDGTLDMDRMLEHVDKNTILVACMMVNNEVGTRNDVERLAAEVKRRNSRTIVHVDAVQAWMRVPIKLDEHRHPVGERPQDPRPQGHRRAVPFRPSGAGVPAAVPRR